MLHLSLRKAPKLVQTTTGQLLGKTTGSALKFYARLYHFNTG